MINNSTSHVFDLVSLKSGERLYHEWKERTEYKGIHLPDDLKYFCKSTFMDKRSRRNTIIYLLRKEIYNEYDDNYIMLNEKKLLLSSFRVIMNKTEFSQNYYKIMQLLYTNGIASVYKDLVYLLCINPINGGVIQFLKFCDYDFCKFFFEKVILPNYTNVKEKINVLLTGKSEKLSAKDILKYINETLQPHSDKQILISGYVFMLCSRLNGQ